MNIWCPECGSFQFNFSPLNADTKQTATGPQLVFKDLMVCKSCNFSFQIDWLEPERKWWVSNNVKLDRPKFNTKKYVKR